MSSLKMKSSKIIILTLMVIIGVLVDVGLQIDNSIIQRSPTQTPKAKVPIIGVIILCVICFFVAFGLIILGSNYIKARKFREDHEITPTLYSTEKGINPYPFSERLTIEKPTHALTTDHYDDDLYTEDGESVSNSEYNEGTYTGVTNTNYIPQQTNSLSMHSIKRNYSIPRKNFVHSNSLNSLGKGNKFVKFGPESVLNDNQNVTQTWSVPDILYDQALKKDKYDVSLSCKQCGGPIHSRDSIISKTLSFKYKNNIIYQVTNHSDDQKMCKACNLLRTKPLETTYNNHYGEEKKHEIENSHVLQHGIPTELYIDELSIAGQGTVGLKFQAKENFRIVLNSNKGQSNNKSNVIVLDIGEDVTYFRKCNNNDPRDILAFTKEQRALLDKDKNQFYWLSHDKKNRRLRFGKGSMQSLLTVFYYDFPPKPSQGVDGFSWIEKLRYVAISGITFKNFEKEPKIELKNSSLPVTVDLPPLIITHEDATLEDLEKGKATVIENLPAECKELYWNVIGSKITLNTSDFPDFADAIEYSINTPGLACYEKLKEKASGFGNHDPKKSYLRITLGEDRGNSPGVPYVMEIWPSGHYSPIHSHSNSFGIIKVLYNEIQSRFFTGLEHKDQEWYREATFKEGQVTWISDKLYQTHQLWNRTRKVCVTIQCYQYGGKNNEHYEFFDYVDNSNVIRQFRPNSDWAFAEFKRIIKKEWDRYKYLSGEISRKDLDLKVSELKELKKP